jgi:hypothetical protein
MTAKTRAITSLHRDSFLPKVPGSARCLRRLTQTSFIAARYVQWVFAVLFTLTRPILFTACPTPFAAKNIILKRLFKLASGLIQSIKLPAPQTARPSQAASYTIIIYVLSIYLRLVPAS